jgi:hypothetical protein
VVALALPAVASAASVTTGEASALRSSSAVLNGQVDPTGDPGIVECRFEHVTQAAFEATGFTDLSSGGATVCSDAPPYAAATQVAAQISGLDAGESYRFRVVAVTTSSGTLEGADRGFATLHGKVGSFGDDGMEGSTFAGTAALSNADQFGFDATHRRLYVIDRFLPGFWGVDVSSAAPPFPPLEGFDPLTAPGEGGVARGIAVDDSGGASAGDVYYVGGKHIHCYRPLAVLPGVEAECAGFEEIDINESGTAVVDSAGHLWVEGRSAGSGLRLDEYGPGGGAPLSSVLPEALPAGLGGLSGIAIGADDSLYVLAGNRRSVWELDPASGYTSGEELIPDPGHELGRAIAFDRANNHLYVASADAIAEYDAAGEQIDEFATDIPGSEFRAMGVDPTSHRVFVADADPGSGGVVRVFEGGAAIPVLGVSAPAGLTNTSAELSGTVNPQGSELTECSFQYVEEAAYAAEGFNTPQSAEADCEPKADSIPADEADHAVSAQATGLSPATAYRFRLLAANAEGQTSLRGAFTTPGPPAAETTGSPVPDGTSAVLSGRVDPQGAATKYRFEYGSAGPCGPNPCAATQWTALRGDEVQQFFASGSFELGFSGGVTASIPAGASPAQVRAALEALPAVGAGGVEVAGGQSFGSSPPRYTVTFSGALAGEDVPAIVVNPGKFGERLAKTPIPGGPGEEVRLVAARVTGLTPETTYHYRLMAKNGNPDGEAVGEDMTLTTHPAAAPTNPEFPHPPGNERAWEQVSIADSGGNPANFALGFANDGNRALYQVAGGTPISESGTFFSQLLAERPPGEHPSESWRQVNVTPRSLFAEDAKDWLFFPSTDFASFVGYNLNAIGFEGGQGQNLWRIAPPAVPEAPLLSFLSEDSSEFFEASDDAARVVAVVKGSLDAAHPEADGSQFHLYDISDGHPHLLDLLPEEDEESGETIEKAAACGVSSADPVAVNPAEGAYSYQGFDLGKRRWLSADGERAIFPSKGDSCAGPVQLYVREIDAEQTKPISAPALSGLECSAAFIRATAQAAFFWTPSRLKDEDSEPASCGGGRDGDVYRYGFASEDLQCVTCVVAGRDADVQVTTNGPNTSALEDVGVSRDGSAVYFSSPERLVDGAAPEGAYRVEVGGGQLEYVAPGGMGVGDRLGSSSAVSADGEVLVFRSEDARLDPQGGATNGGFAQYYRYDHADRSLICVSCPPDGSPPRGEAIGISNFGTGFLSAPRTYNGSPLSADGSVFLFDTPSALVNADQNTTPAGENPQHGQDVYEWRDGRALLISDGISGWSGGGALGEAKAAPSPAAVSPDGKNVYFFAAQQLTPDAPDPYTRLYDARLGGGIRFPAAARECELEVCQGTPAGAPEAAAPATGSFKGAGNVREAGGCARQARTAHRLARTAKRLRHRARRAEGRRAKALRGKARRLSRRAQQLSKQAKRCRRAERRAGR